MFLLPCFMWEETRVHFVSFSKTAVKQLVFFPFCGDCSARWRLTSYTYLRKGLFLVNSFLFASSTWFIFLPDPTWTCYCVCLLIVPVWTFPLWNVWKNFVNHNLSTQMYVCMDVFLLLFFNVKEKQVENVTGDFLTEGNIFLLMT